MADAYEALDRATAGICAHVILLNGEPVGRLVTKRRASGNVVAFLQVWGAPTVQGTARGGGYDKRSAAIAAAIEKLRALPTNEDPRVARVFEYFAMVDVTAVRAGAFDPLHGTGLRRARAI